jgi:hypothetical protein
MNVLSTRRDPVRKSLDIEQIHRPTRPDAPRRVAANFKNAKRVRESNRGASMNRRNLEWLVRLYLSDCWLPAGETTVEGT